jgi:tetratricopeptide (TPR) repeat protein
VCQIDDNMGKTSRISYDPAHMVILKITLGILLLLAAWGYLFQKKLIFKLNAWMREIVFSDQVALFSGRRVAILLMVLGGISLFSGLGKFVQGPTFTPEISAQMLAQARQDLMHKEYPNAIRRGRELAKANPKSIEVWEFLAEAYSRAGDKDRARKAATILLQLDPNNQVGKTIAPDVWEKRRRDK